MKGKAESTSQFLFGREAEERGLRRVLSRIFRERELIVRTDGRVQFLRVGAKVQMAAAGILIGGAIWAATAIPVTITQGITIATDKAQILEAKLAYEDLIDEISGYQRSVDAVSGTLRENRAALEAKLSDIEAVERRLAAGGVAQAAPRAAVAASREALRQNLAQIDGALQGIASDGDELETMVAKIRTDLADSSDGHTLVARARARLKERAESLETRLTAVLSENQTIEDSNATLTSDLKMTTAERDGLLKQRADLSGQIEILREQLAVLETERDNLTGQNADLTAALETSRAEGETLLSERDTAQEQLAALDVELELTRKEGNAYQDDLREVARNLQSVTGDGGPLDGSRISLRTHIDGLLAELNNQQAAKELVLQRTTERAVSSVQEAEKIIEMAGLRVDGLLSRAQDSAMGQGGPFVAAGGDLPDQGEVGETVQSLDTNMSRWESLKQVLRALPLSLPVDYYHLTSDFGQRVDPVNGRRSMHNGVDMAGWMKSPIWAAAPGTIVFSGVKGRYGNVVEIDHGFGIRTRYAHLDKTLVQVGDVVGHRERIALLGSSGRSTGPHLHYEVLVDGKALDPMNFIKAGRYVFKN